jgi:hypothetical protein
VAHMDYSWHRLAHYSSALWYPMIASIFTTHRLLGAKANYEPIDGTNWLIFSEYPPASASFPGH